MEKEDVERIVNLLVEIRDGINRLEEAVAKQTESVESAAEQAELATHSTNCKCGRC